MNDNHKQCCKLNSSVFQFLILQLCRQECFINNETLRQTRESKETNRNHRVLFQTVKVFLHQTNNSQNILIIGFI